MASSSSPRSSLLDQIQARRNSAQSIPHGTSPHQASHLGLKHSHEVEMHLHDYSPNHLETLILDTPTQSAAYREKPNPTWLHLTGVHEEEQIKELSQIHEIPTLIIEDILHTTSRPRVELSDDSIFLQLRLFSLDDEDSINIQSLSLYLTPNVLLTFAESPTQTFNHLLTRLTETHAKVRQEGLDYLFWRILDSVSDCNLSAVSSLHDTLFKIDQDLIDNLNATTAAHLYNLQREASIILRLTRPNRDMITTLINQKNPLIKKATLPFFLDLRDHALSMTEDAESLREFAAASREYQLNESNQRLNNVMRILTVISTIFLPLTFIAGIYGMNFKNMPELESNLSYPVFWIFSLILTVTLLCFFKKKQWL